MSNKTTASKNFGYQKQHHTVVGRKDAKAVISTPDNPAASTAAPFQFDGSITANVEKTAQPRKKAGQAANYLLKWEVAQEQ